MTIVKSSLGKKTLHEVIEDVLQKAGKPLTIKEIARGVNTLGTYHRKDGGAIPSSQISARINGRPQFDINNNVSPRVVSLKKHE